MTLGGIYLRLGGLTLKNPHRTIVHMTALLHFDPSRSGYLRNFHLQLILVQISSADLIAFGKKKAESL